MSPNVRLNDVDLDPDTVIYSIQIQHGRPDIFSTPGPSTAAITLIGPTGLDLEVTDEIRIGVDGTCRFRGNITDLDVEFLGDGTPLTSVLAVGKLALLGSRLTDPNDHVKETARERVERVLTDSGLDYLNGATPDLELHKPTEETPYPITTALQNLAEWTGGTYFDTPTGWIVFESYGVRGQTANPGNWQAQIGTWADTQRAWDSFPTSLAALELDPDTVVFAPTWRKSSTGIINKVEITHGTTGTVDTFSDADSITAYGERAVEITTQLEHVSDATARANQILLAQAYPRWNLGSVSLLVHELDQPTRDKALVLISGSAVIVKGLPVGAPYQEFGGIVEGWTEVLTPGQQILTLSLSDRRFSYQTVPWENVDGALTWENVNAASQWYNVVYAADLVA